MTVIDNTTGAEVKEPEETPRDNVRNLGEARKRAKGRRVKSGAAPQNKPLAQAVIDSAQETASSIPDALSESMSNLSEGVQATLQGAQTTLSAGWDIGKLLLIGVAVFAILEFTADRRLKRYSGD